MLEGFTRKPVDQLYITKKKFFQFTETSCKAFVQLQSLINTLKKLLEFDTTYHCQLSLQEFLKVRYSFQWFYHYWWKRAHWSFIIFTKFCIILLIYYSDILPEFSSILSNFQPDCQIFLIKLFFLQKCDKSPCN